MVRQSKTFSIDLETITKFLEITAKNDKNPNRIIEGLMTEYIRVSQRVEIINCSCGSVYSEKLKLCPQCGTPAGV